MRVLERLQDLIRITFSPERLEDAPEAAADTPRPRLFRTLTGREVLAEDPPAAGGNAGLLAVLLRSEELPLDPPAPASGRRSFLGTLLSRERLPGDEQPPRGRA